MTCQSCFPSFQYVFVGRDELEEEVPGVVGGNFDRLGRSVLHETPDHVLRPQVNSRLVGM